MAEWISGVLRDAAGYLRDGLWNLGMGAYAIIVLGWQVMAGVGDWQARPADHICGVLFAAAVLGSAGAYRKASVRSRWDRLALQAVNWRSVSTDEHPGSHTFRLEVEARKSLPQPTRVRIWWNQRPLKDSVRAVLWIQKRGTGREVLHIGQDVDGSVKTLWRRTEIEILAPAIDRADTSLAVLVGGTREIRFRGLAAYRPGD